MTQNLKETDASSSNLTQSSSDGCRDSRPFDADAGESGPPSVVALCAADLQAMQFADDRYQDELVRVYGRGNAGDARYKRFHQDVGVQAAGDAFVSASRKWQATLCNARAVVAAHPQP